MLKPYIVTSPKQLLAISSPGRDEIIDIVGLLGPCTVREMARASGRPRNALYYHVRALRDCGLLIESRSAAERRETVARYALAGYPLFVRFDLTTKRSRGAVLALVSARIRRAARGFRRACHPEVAVVEGRDRNLWGTRWEGLLSESGLREMNRLFMRQIALLKPKAANANRSRKLYELTFVFAPVIPERGRDTSDRRRSDTQRGVRR
jgi:DNA-binding transcriptional ArsR family regulator